MEHLGLISRYAIDALIVIIFLKWCMSRKRRRRKYLNRKNAFRLAVIILIINIGVPRVLGPVSPRFRHFPGFIEAHKLRLYYLIWGTIPGRNATQSRIEGYIREAHIKYGLEAAFIKAVIQVESGFDQYAVSGVGACGLMQLLPRTFYAYGWGNPYGAKSNIFAGSCYLKSLLNRFGNKRNALAAYNAGPSAVRRHGGVPPYRETRNYVANVLRYYSIFNANQ